MKTEYKKDLSSTYFVLEEEEIFQMDYQIRMLRTNEIPGLLKIKARGADETSRFYYDIRGKSSLQSIYEKAEIKSEELVLFLKNLSTAITFAEKHMLDSSRILLEPECIFCDKEGFYFCYYPLGQQEFCEVFHKLTEYFVTKVSYQDKQGIFLAYELHKLTMEENYSILEVIKSISEEMEEEKAAEQTEESQEAHIEEQEPMLTDWSTEDWIETDLYVAEEDQTIWNSIKKLWEKRKKPMWGDWKKLKNEENRIDPI